MAGSRRARRKAEAGPLEAVAALLAATGSTAGVGAAGVGVGIAFSGGLDSSALLHAAAAIVPVDRLFAFHVDHGLHPRSADWVRHCARQAEALGVSFHHRRLATKPAPGESLEAWARTGRYAALAELSAEAGTAVLLTAHHADDQLETLLMRLARGTGIDGLTGIEADTRRGSLRLLRPWLNLPRAAIERWAREQALDWIEDPSNTDEALLRNAVRRRLIPEIDRVLPGLRKRLPDTLGVLREARSRLQALEAEDLAGALVSSTRFGPCLSLKAWHALPPARRPGVLRRWLAARGTRMPSQARLAEIVRQLGSPRGDAQLHLGHDDKVLRRYRGLIMLAPPALSLPPAPAPPVTSVAMPIDWQAAGQIDRQGVRQIDCPAFGGMLQAVAVTDPDEEGVPVTLLQAGDLVLRHRAGGERLRTHRGGPRRSLKNLFQERGVPPWQRVGLPVLWSDGGPVWVPGLGLDAECSVRSGERYRLQWIGYGT
ncbi:MAG: tRNA lysidine(34) synthetase TilS [Burkholderiaceae bacterium]